MKLIIRAPNWVGDAIMALPAIDIARDSTGAGHIAVMARKSVASLFKHHPDVNRVIGIDDRDNKLIRIRRAASLIKEDRFDVGVILPRSFSSALIFKMGKVKGRIGYTGDGRSWLLSKRIKSPTAKTHRVLLYLNLFERLTGEMPVFRPPRLYLSHEDIDTGNKILKGHKLSYDDNYVVIAPQAVAESRRWGILNYAALARRITEQPGLKVLLIGVSSDHPAGEQVKNGSQAIINLCGRTSLLSAGAVLSFAKLFIGNDSGLAHLAGAVGCPLVVLSGADDPSETSPMFEKKTVLIKDIDCISCIRNICPKSGDEFMRCMKLISIDEVFDAVRHTARI